MIAFRKKQSLDFLYKNRVSLCLLALGILGYSAKFMLNILLSQYLTPVLYGDFNIGARVLYIFTSIALLGTDNAAIRFLSRYMENGEILNVQTFFKWSFSLIIYSSSILFVIGVGSYIVMGLLHVWQIKDIRSYHLAFYMLWVAPVTAVFYLLIGYLFCLEFSIFPTLVQRLKPLFYIIFFSIFAFFLHFNLESMTLFYSIFFTFVTLDIMILFFVFFKAPGLMKVASNAYAVRRGSIPKAWISMSMNLGFNSILFVVICATDLIIIKLLKLENGSVALYAVALTITSVVCAISRNIYNSITAIIGRSIKVDKNRVNLETSIKKINRIMLFIVILEGCCIFYFSRSILMYFGAFYLNAEIPLKILTIGFMIGAFAQPAITVMAYAGAEKLLLKISMFEFTLLLVCGVIFTYFFGIIGMATATSLSIVVKTVVFHYAAHRALKVKTFHL